MKHYRPSFCCTLLVCLVLSLTSGMNVDRIKRWIGFTELFACILVWSCVHSAKRECDYGTPCNQHAFAQC